LGPLLEQQCQFFKPNEGLGFTEGTWKAYKRLVLAPVEQFYG